MSCDWKETSLKDIVDRFAMGPFGSNIKSENFMSSGVPVIRGVNLSKDRFYDDEFVFLSEEKADTLRNNVVHPLDIVFTHRGTLGQVGIVPENSYPRYVVSQSQMMLSCNRKRACPGFLYYFFKSPIGQHKLLCNASTTGVPAIARPLASLKSITLKLPDLAEQQAIAATLSCLDDKIELNNRINKVLEEMAQALFKSWFVDFEPFQDGEFVDSELGPIPKGWTVGRLGDIVENIREIIDPQKELETRPYVGLEHVPRKCLTLSQWGTSDGLGSSKYKFLCGDILFGKLRPYFHKVSIAPVDGICSTDILVLRPNHPKWFALAVCYVFSTGFIDHADSTSTGTRMPRASWKDMSNYAIILPPEGIVEAFSETIAAILESLRKAVHQNRRMSEIRDTLLPKLMSGEVRVPLSESETEAAAASS